jgi:hypothetical protein
MLQHITVFLGWLVTCIGVLDHAQTHVNPVDGGPDMAGKTSRAYGATRTTARTTLEARVAESGTVVVAIAGSAALRPNDGASDAPICKMQHPFLLDRYKARPAWRVAGVDYCVGYPASTVLKDPTTISMPGVTVNTANQTVTVTGSNVTLDGYDFSLNGGWQVTVASANTRIHNSKFMIGSNEYMPIVGTNEATNLYVGYCVIDGQNYNAGWGTLINWNGVDLSVEYCWLKNSGGDSIQGSSGGQINLRYNLIEQAGQTPGAHGDFLQVIGSDPYSASILYNTTLQTSGFTQGFMLEPGIGSTPGIVTSAEYGYNTMIAQNGSTVVQYYFTGVTAAYIVNTVTWHDNYFAGGGLAPGGIRSGPNDSSPKTIFVNNVNMVTGAVVQESNPTPRMRGP